MTKMHIILIPRMAKGNHVSAKTRESDNPRFPITVSRLTARKTYKLCITLPLRCVLSSGVPAQKVDNAESLCRSRPHIDTYYYRFEYNIDGLMQERRDSFATHCSKIFLAPIHQYGSILRAAATGVMRLFVYIGVHHTGMAVQGRKVPGGIQ